ncbi:Lysophospholipase D gdpd1 [Dinochytrium kinnereticum]|nr:Lysophospholipase D gdpd1 [Dinochytrium kinnereticum]
MSFLFKPQMRATLGKRITFPHALMSHRGGSLEHIENTLPGFRYSAHKLKMDVYMTKDNVCVVFHDSDMGRLCGLVNRKISDFNYNELPPLLVPKHLEGKQYLVRDPDARRIPRLEELFNEFPRFVM